MNKAAFHPVTGPMLKKSAVIEQDRLSAQFEAKLTGVESPHDFHFKGIVLQLLRQAAIRPSDSQTLVVLNSGRHQTAHSQDQDAPRLLIHPRQRQLPLDSPLRRIHASLFRGWDQPQPEDDSKISAREWR
jgi:hypothetical protein